MKRYLFAILACSLLFCSCSNRLNIYPHSAISPDGVTDADLPALRFGVYSAMQTKFGVVGNIAFDVLGGDITQKNYNPIDVYNNYLKTLGTNVSSQWNNLYNQLYHVNVLIAATEKAGIEANAVTWGEAHYFRAMIYLNLVTRWGGVPVLRQNTMEPVSRNTEEETWSFINEDLAIAMAYLGDSGNYWLVSYDAAVALAARAYLYQGDMNKAYEYAEQLIKGPRYQLADDFTSIFGYERKANKEIIFGFFNDDAEGGLNIGSQYFTYDYVNKGSGVYFPTTAIQDLFKDNDTRKAVSIVTVGTDKCMGKYPGGQAKSDPVIISRIGEMFLISAEAQGFPDGALRLNELRAKRGLGPTTASTEEEFEDAILLERRLELLGENLVWYDYIRMGKWDRLGIMEYQTLFPIPEGEIRLNNNLKQNPGWGGNEQ